MPHCRERNLNSIMFARKQAAAAAAAAVAAAVLVAVSAPHVSGAAE